MMRVLMAAALCAGLLVPAHADTVYRWVDAQGHVHYSQTPPANSKTAARAVDIVPPPSDPTTVARIQDMQQAVQDRQGAQQLRDQKAQQEAARKARQEKACAAARARVQRYNEVNRVAKKDKEGHEDYYSGDDLVKLRQQAQAEADKLCGA